MKTIKVSFSCEASESNCNITDEQAEVILASPDAVTEVLKNALLDHFTEVDISAVKVVIE